MVAKGSWDALGQSHQATSGTTRQCAGQRPGGQGLQGRWDVRKGWERPVSWDVGYRCPRGYQEMWSGLDACRQHGAGPTPAGVYVTKTWVHSACPGGTPTPHGGWSSSLPGLLSTEPTGPATQQAMAECGQSQGLTTRRAGRGLRVPGPQAHGDKCVLLGILRGPHILSHSGKMMQGCNKVHWGGRGQAGGL